MFNFLSSLVNQGHCVATGEPCREFLIEKIGNPHVRVPSRIIFYKTLPFLAGMLLKKPIVELQLYLST